MKQIGHLTNERLRNLFDNQFELVNYAIRLAEHYIRSGKEPFVSFEPRNLSSQILDVIESGKDELKEVPTEEVLIARIEEKLVTEKFVAPSVREELVTNDESDDISSNETEAIEAM